MVIKLMFTRIVEAKHLFVTTTFCEHVSSSACCSLSETFSGSLHYDT